MSQGNQPLAMLKIERHYRTRRRELSGARSSLSSSGVRLADHSAVVLPKVVRPERQDTSQQIGNLWPQQSVALANAVSQAVGESNEMPT
jgi:hypothetical protein